MVAGEQLEEGVQQSGFSHVGTAAHDDGAVQVQRGGQQAGFDAGQRVVVHEGPQGHVEHAALGLVGGRIHDGLGGVECGPLVQPEGVVGADHRLGKLRSQQQMTALLVRGVEFGHELVGELLHAVLVRGEYPLES